MNLYDLVRTRSHKSLSITEVEKIVGTLRLAGISSYSTSVRDVAEAIVDAELSSPAPALRPHKASKRTASAPRTAASTGMCPRCKKPMKTVKLADYRNATYCPECRTTLWT